MPKTIDQIHQEAEREAREQQINIQNMSSNNYKRMPDDRDRRKPAGVCYFIFKESIYLLSFWNIV